MINKGETRDQTDKEKNKQAIHYSHSHHGITEGTRVCGWVDGWMGGRCRNRETFFLMYDRSQVDICLPRPKRDGGMEGGSVEKEEEEEEEI